MPRAVVLLSGGLDSTTVLAMAKADGFQIDALTVAYGQRHAAELDAAHRVARYFGVERHEVVEIPLRQIGGSALTSDMEVPKAEAGAPVEAGIPPTYVPARNTLFLALALGLAETTGAQDLFLGVSAVDYSGYPDCRPEFLEQFERLANVGTRAGIEGRPFRIRAPLVQLSKAETIKIGIRLGVDYAMTHSCYDPEADGRPCGRCDSCRLRARAFDEAGFADPLLGKFDG